MSSLQGKCAAQARAASGTNIVLGIWLILSPWIYDLVGTTPVVTEVLIGFLIAILAACRLAEIRLSLGLSGVNFVLGVWTLSAPWVVDYGSNEAAVRNNVVVGVAIALLALWSAGASLACNRHPSRSWTDSSSSVG